MVKLFQALSRRATSLIRRTKGKEVIAEVAQQHVDLNLIFVAAHRECMGLPQELVDYIMDMLQDNLPALKACSLTCTAMFVSARRLIHQTLRLTLQIYHGTLAQEEKTEWCYRELSRTGERGLLQYIRQVFIDMPYGTFTPDTFLLHLHHFQSLDRVHTLTVRRYDVVSWANHWKTCFVHFYPTLTSLALHHSYGHYRLLLQFALQFPNLQSLCLESVRYEREPVPGLIIPPTIGQSPPLRGRLRLAGIVTADQWLADVAGELQNGFNFRSLELEDFLGVRGRHVLNACADTLEDLTIVPSTTGYKELRSLDFQETKLLRRLTLHMTFPQVFFPDTDTLLETLSTITSPVFCEFVLELDKYLSDLDVPSPRHWRYWEKIDEFLEQRFAERGDFRLVIRTRPLDNREIFQTHAKEGFPLLARRGCFLFETSLG